MPQFVKVMAQGNQITLQAWIKMAWLPGVYSGEIDLTGTYGWALKGVLKDRVKSLEASLA